MTIELKIDTNALMTLFPEGSEARLNLRNAVLEEATRRLVKAATTKEIEQAANLLSKKISDEVTGVMLKDYAKYNGAWRRDLELRPEFKSEIVKAVYDSVQRIVGDISKDNLDYYRAHLQSMVHTAMGAQARAAIKEAVDKELDVHRESIQSSAKEMVLRALNIKT